MPRRPYHAHLEDLPKEWKFNDTYKRVGVVSDHALVSFIWVDGDFEEPEGARGHSHVHDQINYVISGRMKMILNGTDEYVLETGDVLYIPSNVPHLPRIFEGESCFTLEVFAPIRTDYLHLVEHQVNLGGEQRGPDGIRRAPRKEGS